MAKLEVGVNDLATLRPDLLKEWDFDKNTIKPTEIMPGSNKKVWWVCAKGHSYETVMVLRTKGHGCPYCAGKKALEGYNDLGTLCPALIKEWDFEKNEIKPTQVTMGSGKVVWWRCQAGHSYQAEVSVRTINHLGCPYCSGRLAVEGVTDLATVRPDILKYWDYTKNEITPQRIPARTSREVWWKCEKGHSYQQAVNYKIDRNVGCPICSNRRVLQGFNDLATQHPELLKEWDYEKNTIKPQEVVSLSNKKVWWKCSKGHSYETSIAIRVGQHSGCPYCCGRKVVKKHNDFQTEFLELCKEWDYEKNTVLPDEVSGGSSKKVWWKCEHGHSYQMSLYNKTRGCRCPICTNRKVLVGYNDLATTHPWLLLEWDYSTNKVTPQEVTAGSGKRINWCCSLGHKWSAILSSRALFGVGCPICNSSAFEQRIHNVLKAHNISYIQEYHPVDLVTFSGRYDIYISTCLLIEADGEQHFRRVGAWGGGDAFRERCRHDNIKTEYAFSNNLPLLRIPYPYSVKAKELEGLILQFIRTRVIPKEIIKFYKQFDFSNYAQLAERYNANLLQGGVSVK